MVNSRSITALGALTAASLSSLVSAHAHEGVGFHVPHAERAMNEVYLANLRARFGEAPARVVNAHLEKRQAMSTGTSAAASAASTGGALASTGASGASAAPTANSTVTMGTIPIGITTTIQATSPLPTTYVAGTTAPIEGAPVLPVVNINPADWPALDLTPPTNSSQVQEWISQIDWSQVPDIPVNQPGGCANATNVEALQNAAANGWWTCGGHTRSSDVVDCPQKNTWGLSYDDGPSPDTPRLLNYMVENDLKATFFVVGSRAISRPQMLQYEYMAGNQISVHTWAHPQLTTRTNEEIVAELGWSKEAIRQIIGVTPNTMRPPYGDIDDRVRAISLQMGLTPIIWTSVNGSSFDTFDWEIAGGVVNADTVVAKFQGIIDNATRLDTGFIVLEHDLYQQSTSLAIDYVLPYALAKNTLTLEPIYQCLGQQLSDVYIETASNTTDSVAVETTLDRGSRATNGAAAAGAAASSKSGAGSTGAADKQATVVSGVMGAVLGLAAVAVAL